MLIGGERNMLPGDLAGGYYVKPTVFKGHNKMRVFQEEIFGPVVSVDDLQGRRGGAVDRQRHALRSRRGRLEPRRQPLLPLRPRDPGRPRVDQLLPRLSRACGVRRLQAVGRSAARTTR